MGSYTGGGASTMEVRPGINYDLAQTLPAKEFDPEANKDFFEKMFGHAETGQQPPAPSPGQEPPPLPGQEQPQDQKQYFDAMRTNLDGLSEAFKQIENLSMPGGQHGGQMDQMPGGNVGKGAGGGAGRKFNPNDFMQPMIPNRFDMRSDMDLYNTGDTGMNLGQ